MNKKNIFGQSREVKAINNLLNYIFKCFEAVFLVVCDPAMNEL
jgi:hypothetical protein